MRSTQVRYGWRRKQKVGKRGESCVRGSSRRLLADTSIEGKATSRRQNILGV